MLVRVTSAFMLPAVTTAFWIFATPARALVQNTVTTLVVTQPGSTAPHAATLTATVTANGQHLRRGIVTFCDATTRPCIDLAVLGTASVTGNGTAKLKKVFAPGTHTVYAFYNATATSGRSESMIETVVTPGEVATTAAIAKASQGGSVAVQARVAATTAAPLAGTASLLLDRTKTVVASAPITRAAISTSRGPLINSPIPNAAFFVTDIFTSITADFNADGLPDVAISVANYPLFGGGSGIQIMLNDPEHPGQFVDGGVITSNQLEQEVGTMIAGDFNGDGAMDIVFYAFNVAYHSTGANEFIALGDPAHPGQFKKPTIIDTPARFLAAADMNGDGFLDLIGYDPGSQFDQPGITVLFNDAQYPGQFFDSYKFPYSEPPNTNALPYVTDMNRDGLPDILFVDGQNDVQVLFNDQTEPGHFLSPVLNTYTGPYSLDFASTSNVVADFNHDGLPDFAVGAGLVPGINQPTDNAVAVFLNDPAMPGRLLPPTIYPVGRVYPSLAAGNFHSAKNLDLLFTESGYVLPADPAHPGKFLPLEPLTGPLAPPPSSSPDFPYDGYDLYTADLDGDGYSDIVALQTFFEDSTFMGSSLTQVNQSSTASFPNLPLNGTHPERAHVMFEGNDDFAPSASCSIDLSVVIPQKPAASNVQATSSGPSSETISYTANGLQDSVSYGTTTALGSTVQAASAGSPIVLNGLTANTTYYYQLTTTSFATGCVPLVTQSPVGTFTTEQAATF